jgi:aerobic carbon-monoxide dehydrogenase medium subunit
MKPAPFIYERSSKLDDVLDTLDKYGDDCKILAGGQSLIPMMNLRILKPERLVDINALSELDYVRIEGNNLLIGGLTRHTTLRESSIVNEHCPLMSEAYLNVAHRPVRNRGTIGGNLSHAYPASEMPAVTQAVDASMLMLSKAGQREIEAKDFFIGAMETPMEANELLAEIRIPIKPPGQGWSFMEVSPRKGDFAMLGVATTLMVKDGVCKDVRIVHCGVGDRAERVIEVEDMLIKQKASEQLFREAGEKASLIIDPESDFHADEAYRRDLMKTLTRRTLMKALERCE